MPFVLHAQANLERESTEKLLQRFLSSELLPVQPSTLRITRFLDKLSEDPTAYRNHQQRFVRQLFTKVHSRFLRNFRQDASFSQLFSNGNYNCLTATALMAVALERFDYHYTMFETDHHIFLIVETDRGKALLETTDPMDGFVTKPEAIQQRIEKYKLNTAAPSRGSLVEYEFRQHLYREVDITDLKGLLHFNIAVDAFNEKKYEQAVEQLEQASLYYNSSRIIEFAEVMSLTVRERNLPEASAKLETIRSKAASAVSQRLKR